MYRLKHTDRVDQIQVYKYGRSDKINMDLRDEDNWDIFCQLV